MTHPTEKETNAPASPFENGVSRAMIQQIVEANADAILVVDGEGKICYGNPAAAKLFGSTTEKLCGRPFGVPVVANEFVEIRIPRCAAGIVIAEMRASKTEFAGNDAYVVSLRDVTERKQLEENLLQSQRMEALGSLAGGIAHDFNNLLTSILSFSSLMLERLDPADPSHRHASQIRTIANRAAGLTGQLLTFSRKGMAKPEVQDLNDIVNEMSLMLGRILGERVRLVTKYSAEPAWVNIDRVQIEQVITNLAVNARDAMTDGGTITCTVGLSKPERKAGNPCRRQVTLTLRDEGCGMDESTQRRAFEPFFTTKSETKGTGLGLSTVHGIVHQAGGRVVLTSAPEQGTTVCVALPSQPPARKNHNNENQADGCMKLRRNRLLVVEDEPAIREVLAEVLGSAGYDVTTASCADEGLRIVHRATMPFDAILSDVVMPGDSGPQLIKDVRELHPSIPALFMSGYPKDELPQRVIDDLRTDFVPKPFATQTLLSALDSLINENEKNDESETQQILKLASTA